MAAAGRAHPALSPETQVALTLRFVGGLTAAEIARAFGATEATIAQRLSRAKRKIKAARIGRPEPGRIGERLDVVLTVVYAIYNEGYVTTSGELSRFDLSQEGVRLARLVVAHSRGEVEAKGLLALLLLLQACRPARVGEDGRLIPLTEQDRSSWDDQMSREGQALVRECLTTNQPGPYQLQAAIQAVHCDASRDDDTDWGQILALAAAPTTSSCVESAADDAKGRRQSSGWVHTASASTGPSLLRRHPSSGATCWAKLSRMCRL